MNAPARAARDPLRIAAFVSGHGRGTNLQAIIDGCVSGRILGQVVLVVGVRDGAPAMDRARAAGAAVVALAPPRPGEPDGAYGDALLRLLDGSGIGLICLAGYMRLLPPAVVRRYANRIMNVHPALLPLFGGWGMYGDRVHRAVLDSGMRVSGCTVHFVDEEYDHGPIILQTVVPVLPGDDVEALSRRVLRQEHRTYVDAVMLFSRGKIAVKDRRVQWSD